MASQSRKDLESSSRITAIAIIWGCATGILALSIPLAAVTENSVLLVGVIMLGAAVATSTVWRTLDHRPSQKLISARHLEKLEERIADLEAICSSTEFDFTQKVNQLESNDQNKNS
jgi:hypothetical protein